MKVYVVRAFTAESYENSSWIYGIYHKREDAEAALGDKYKVYDADEENYDSGYMIDHNIQEIEVQ